MQQGAWLPSFLAVFSKYLSWDGDNCSIIASDPLWHKGEAAHIFWVSDDGFFPVLQHQADKYLVIACKGEGSADLFPTKLTSTDGLNKMGKPTTAR
jgi:hypothetical protein